MTHFLQLKKSNCKNCYKCIRHCPVKSIRFSGNQAHIMSDDCILCGQCFVVCPQDAKEIVSEIETVKVLLQEDAPVYASIAPSFLAYFEGSGMIALRTALKTLGFTDAEETAIGATMVKREYDRLVNEGRSDVLISSCCHSVNLLIQKYYPALLKYLAPVVTPMHAHCLDIKRRYPNAKTVFIGPCLSKKDEAEAGVVDAVLTFQELATMLQNKGIEVKSQGDDCAESRARLFPLVGGILKTMACDSPNCTYLAVDGVENCKNALEDIASGSLRNCFIEMSACTGGCIGGPVMEKYRNRPVRHFQAISRYAGSGDFPVEQPDSETIHKLRQPDVSHMRPHYSDEEINAMLVKMGKTDPAQLLNCGSCGYDSCWEKAIAVLQGKADISMCLPYLSTKSEQFSNNILNNTPNGILVVNEALEIQQINPAAMKMLRIRSQKDILGELVVRIMNPLPFLDVSENGKKVFEQREYYAEYEKYLELTIVHDKTSRQLISILRDVTQEETDRRSKASMARQTAEIADHVVDNQMRIVQEIASLLGETAAETKIALTKLKESMPYEQDN